MKHTLSGSRRLVLLLFGSALALGCGRASPPNVLLVTVDTLRADHLPFYGYERSTMPRMAGWIPEATVFERCFSPTPLTDPSMASLLTGMHPLRHGVRHSARGLDVGFSTLPQLMREHGYVTAAFVSRAGLVNEGFLGRGFDHSDFVGGAAADRLPEGSRRNVEKWQRRADHVTDALLTWLEQPREAPFFVWLHYYDPHAYYDPPEPFDTRFTEGLDPAPVTNLRAWWGRVSDINRTVAAYDGEIATVDHAFDRVTSRLRGSGAWDDTLVIVTSDHGESLGEHAHMDHGEWLYHEQIRVPLVMRLPGTVPAGARIGESVRLIDLAATIIDLTGVRGEDVDAFVAGMDGASLSPLLRGDSADRPRPVFSESENCPESRRAIRWAPGMRCAPPGPEGKLRAFFDGRYKLIITPLPEGRHHELYDLDRDPDESRDLAASDPGRVREMERVMDAYWQQQPTPAPIVEERTREQLKALGYSD